MGESILLTIKKVLGIEPDYTHFDDDIIMHINSALMVLTQLGVGPKEGFFIDDDSATWEEFIGTSKQFKMAKSYLGLKVRLLFDPPSSSVHMNAITQSLSELEWRLNLAAEMGETVNGSSSDSPTNNYITAILGKAVVGQMQIGYAGG